MTGSVAIDVAIGLIFVYLLYSLFATILCEIIASYLGLRGRNLREAIIRLLEDDQEASRVKFLSFFRNIFHSIGDLFLIRGGAIVKRFYQEPTIKYLSRNNFFKSPSYISPANFSKALTEILRQEGVNNNIPDQPELDKIITGISNSPLLGPETKKQIKSLLREANNDLVKFRILLERWYDNTMERAIGWYKQKIQIVLLIIGFFLAASFNVSTIRVVGILSKDDKSREELVKMATAYIENKNKDTTASNKEYKEKLDSLLDIKQRLEGDINAANSIMGLGWNAPDSLPVSPAAKKEALKIPVKGGYQFVEIPPKADTVLLKQMMKKCDGLYVVEKNSYIKLSKWQGFTSNFWGYLITAFAISLGSPFWFDLLSKLVQVRGTVQQPVQTSPTTVGSGNPNVDPILRKG